MFSWVSFVVFGGYGMCGSFWIGDGLFCISLMSVWTFLLWSLMRSLYWSSSVMRKHCIMYDLASSELIRLHCVFMFLILMLRCLSTSLALVWIVSYKVKLGVPCMGFISWKRLWMWSSSGSSSSASL